MEILFYLSSGFLVLFIILATFDGVYLHLWKYELFRRKESRFEHLTHTARALLFPLIVWTVFLNETSTVGFLVGIALILVDTLILGIDAYSEAESRSFMGGLPKWEYIVHLFSNAFHFTVIVLVLTAKLQVLDGALYMVTGPISGNAYGLFITIAQQLLPGAILMALLHLFLAHKSGHRFWNTYRIKLQCC